MVTLDQAILVLVPQAVFSYQLGPGVVCLSMVNGVQTITYWDSALPAQPSPSQLAAVTQQQVTAYQQTLLSNNGANALANAVDPISVGARASIVTAFTSDNDVREGWRAWSELVIAQINAALATLATAANVSPAPTVVTPTASQIAAQVTSDRAGPFPVDPLASTPTAVSQDYNIRIPQEDVLNAITAAIEAGYGLPSGT